MEAARSHAWLRPAILTGLAIHVAHGLTGFGGDVIDWLVVQALYDALMAVAVVACALQARRTPEERRAWVLLAAGLGSGLLGELSWSAGLGDPSGEASICDVFYLGFYPLVIAGCATLAVRGGQATAARLLDALGAALAVGAAGTAWVLGDVFAGVEGDGLGRVVAFAYPALDLVLVAVVVGITAGQKWRPEPRWALIGAGLAVVGAADAVYYAQVAAGGYEEGGVFDSLWPAGILLIAQAATLRPATRPSARTHSLVLPVVLAATALTILVTDRAGSTPVVSVVLACLALIAILARALLAFRENEAMLTRSRLEAVTDGLTGLPNRRALAQELEERTRGGVPTTLLLFDLDGFKSYNDTFGHPAGDDLLVRLGRRLVAVVGDAGTAYRMGGDEFCVLLPLDGGPSAVQVEGALREHGEGYDVGASYGSVALPEEALDPTAALRIADQRLYGRKGRRRASAGSQTGDALVRVLMERDPDLQIDFSGVAHLASAVADELGVGPEESDELRRAAELHDVGKVALPDLLLQKPGPLTPDERSSVEQHTVVGERILLAAPSLRGVGRIVRASHEHWDGTGYPDGLAREEIPLSARIIGTCDAYDAMTRGRPHQSAVPPDAALQELHRCAGTQFDPEVVAAFTRVVRSASAPRGPRRPPSGPHGQGRR